MELTSELWCLLLYHCMKLCALMEICTDHRSECLYWYHDSLSLWIDHRRTCGHEYWMAYRLLFHHVRWTVYGRNCLCDSHRRRSLLLGCNARASSLGALFCLDYRLVQLCWPVCRNDVSVSLSDRLPFSDI